MNSRSYLKINFTLSKFIQYYTDINECAMDMDNCDHICNNTHCTEGKYACSCYEGYVLGSDGHTCLGE